jgi:hypothetical protein
MCILGPGLQRWDLSLFKDTNINERLRSIKAEAANVFNHRTKMAFAVHLDSVPSAACQSFEIRQSCNSG